MNTAAYLSEVSVPDQFLLQMGATGCIRPWRIVYRVWGDRSVPAARESWQFLQKQGWVQPVALNQRRIGWHYKQGRRRTLLELTLAGQQRYRTLTGSEPRESEWHWALHHHVSFRHALAIREARDHLHDMHIPVDDEPHPCPVQMTEPWGPRSEPDLAIYYRERVFPVEVQRDVRIHYLAKWFKSLGLFHRLLLVTFTLARLERQYRLLHQARQQDQLPPGPILMTSLESWEQSDRHFLSL